MSASIEIKNECRGSIYLHFGDIEPMEEPSLVHKDLFISDFLNPIDQLRLKQVADDEGVSCIF